MAIEKSLYAAPQGLDQIAAMDEVTPPIEIEIENPDAVSMHLGDLEINLTPDEGKIGRAHV